MVLSLSILRELKMDPICVVDIVNACMDAMEEGSLPVIAKQYGYYLWEIYILTVDQWARLCALLQRNQCPPRLLWRLHTCVRWTMTDCFSFSKKKCIVDDNPVAMAALSRIEFLWQDLDAVQAWIKWHAVSRNVEWVVAAEVIRRRQWFIGLRRAWLVTVVKN
jgi:hypothetical protein